MNHENFLTQLSTYERTLDFDPDLEIEFDTSPQAMSAKPQNTPLSYSLIESFLEEMSIAEVQY